MRRKKEVQASWGRNLARRYARKAGHILPKFRRLFTNDPQREVYASVCPVCGTEVKVEHYDAMIGDRFERGWRVDDAVYNPCVKKGVCV